MAVIPCALVQRRYKAPLCEINRDRALGSPNPAHHSFRWNPYGSSAQFRSESPSTKPHTHNRLASSSPSSYLKPVTYSDIALDLSLPLSIGRYVLTESVCGKAWDTSNIFRCRDSATGASYLCKIVAPDDPRTSQLLAAHARLSRFSCINAVLNVVRAPIGPASENCAEPKLHEFLFMRDITAHRSVEDVLRARGSFSEAETKALFRQIVSMLAACHQSGVSLRELKLRRLLLMNDGNGIKVTLATLDDCFVFDAVDLAEVNCATPNYLSPEVIKRAERTSLLSLLKIDVWRLGIILYTMLMGRYPFQDSDPRRLMLKVVSGACPPLPAHFSADLKNLLNSLLKLDPQERPTANQILEHAWLRQVVAGRNECPLAA